MAFGSNPAHSMKTRATYEDVLAAPDDKLAELIDGELFLSPRPAARHLQVASVLGVELGGPFQRGRDGPGGWRFLDEPELHFGEDVLVPDLAGWRIERLPAVPDAAFLTLAPDWVCEVVSPSTERIDRSRKMRIYARESVRHAWLVNPVARTLEAYRLGEQGWVLLGTHAGEERVRVEPFDAIELELAVLWPDPPPSS
jgi:Uma2 family endonuclease